jgi:hypothetical protein
MSSPKMYLKYTVDGDDEFDKYDEYDDFKLTQTVRNNTSKNKKNNANVYSQKHVRNCTKKYNK